MTFPSHRPEHIAQAPPGARISGTGHYVPERIVTNLDLEKLVDTSDTWIRERTGIVARRIAAEGENTSDMAIAAARHALASASLAATDLDLIIVATVTPDMPLPATAVYVQRALGATCPAFDLAAACAGFLYGLSVADQFVSRGTMRNVLVIGVELLSRVLDWTDRTTCVLFGDGAGAVVVSPTREEDKLARRGILSTYLQADGEMAEALCIPGGGSRSPIRPLNVDERLQYVHMAGQEIFKFAVRALTSASKAALAANDLEPSDVDWVIAHQANLRIIEAVARRLDVPLDRFFLNIEKYGNTSSASIPIALDEAVREGRLEPGQNVVFCALGGGLAWGSALVRW